MKTKKMMLPKRPNGTSMDERYRRDYIYFTVTFNGYRDVSDSIENEMRDTYEPKECEAVLCLPDSYVDSGAKTPLVLSCHGAGGRVCSSDDTIGGISYAVECLENGYAVLDVCGSTQDGLSMGCPEHIFALHKAYLFAVRNYNLMERVLVTGASMGGHTAMNFSNTFPSVVSAIGLFYPRLNVDGVTINGHYCIGTWDKRDKGSRSFSTHDRIVEVYRFPKDEWCEERLIGFNPYKTRSFINANGERVVIPPCPIKIWQGTADLTVDPVMVEEFVNSVRRSGSYIEYHALDGIAHNLTPVMKKELKLWFDRFI